MKGHAWGRAARPPTISEARAGPEDTGRGWSGEAHGGAPCGAGVLRRDSRVGAPHGPAASVRELRPKGQRGPATPRTSTRHSWTETRRLPSPQGVTSGSARLRAPWAASALRAGVLLCRGSPPAATSRQGRGPRGSGQVGRDGQTDPRPHSPPSSAASSRGTRVGLLELWLGVMAGPGSGASAPPVPTRPSYSPTPGGRYRGPTVGPGVPTSSPRPCEVSDRKRRVGGAQRGLSEGRINIVFSIISSKNIAQDTLVCS